jgi:hypothetical protein
VSLHGGPVAARDRPGELEAVLDRAGHERNERLGRDAGLAHEARRHALKGHEEVRRDRGTGVVDRLVGVGQHERPQAERTRQPAGGVAGSLGLEGEGAPRAVELLRTAVAGEGLERVDDEPTLVRGERGDRGRAAHVGHPGTDLDALRHPADRLVRDGQQHELRVGLGRSPRRDSHIPLPETRGDRAAGAPRSDHVHPLEHAG